MFSSIYCWIRLLLGGIRVLLDWYRKNQGGFHLRDGIIKNDIIYVNIYH
jgi:hypothetical protein